MIRFVLCTERLLFLEASFFILLSFTMPDTKPNTIPQWQRQGATTTSSTESGANSNAPSAADEKPSSRATLLEQAAKFLEHEEIRDASRDQKVTFLEGKGLRRDEIHELLGMLSDEGSYSEETATETVAQSEVNILVTK